jgi:deazaflavin-dependent oxidoreductase (nitroreductase family)
VNTPPPPDWLLKAINAFHRALLKVSGGRIMAKPLGMDTVELHTVGRKSGLPRRTMLTAPISEPDRVVLIASKGGHDQHPAWYLNLQANPEVELTIGRTTRPMKARTATTDEKAELWPTITGAYKGYAGYQRRTERDIPVVICEPR